MSPNSVGLIGGFLLILLLFARMGVGFAMTFVGFLGFAYIEGIEGALGVMATVPYRSIADYVVSVVPLFILMGFVASNTGMCEDLYLTAYKWVGQLPGGLAMATMAACAGFAAICGESMAQAATMGKVAVPEMKKYNYDMRLATGSVASGGTLGILIPPSLGFILYAILTQESVGLLFMAGVLPGILLTTLFIITIALLCKHNPQLGPPGPKTDFKEKITSLKHTGGVLSLFLLVMGGIYSGVFTPTEAGAIGAFGAIVISAVRRKLNKSNFVKSFMETSQITAMIFVMVIGAFVFMRFLAVSKLPFTLAGFVTELQMPRYFIFMMIIMAYVILGMFLDIIATVILTVPIIYPTIIALGFNSIWFGVIIVLVMEMGLITPPVGMNVFIIGGVTDTPLGVVFQGTFPFVIAMIVCVILVTSFPQIALFIPFLLK